MLDVLEFYTEQTKNDDDDYDGVLDRSSSERWAAMMHESKKSPLPTPQRPAPPRPAPPPPMMTRRQDERSVSKYDAVLYTLLLIQQLL